MVGLLLDKLIQHVLSISWNSYVTMILSPEPCSWKQVAPTRMKWTLRERDESRIMANEMSFTWQSLGCAKWDHRKNENILKELGNSSIEDHIHQYQTNYLSCFEAQYAVSEQAWFYNVKLLASSQTPKLLGHSWLAVHDCLFSIFPVNLYIWRCTPPFVTCE